MLYELIAMVRPTGLHEVREIAKTAGMLILNRGGVIRSIQNWDKRLLPTRVKKNQAAYDRAYHFVMRFDGNAAAQAEVRRTLALDPRMVRFSVVKLADKLETVVKV